MDIAYLTLTQLMDLQLDESIKIVHPDIESFNEGRILQSVNSIYEEAAKSNKNGYLMYTEKQNVSSDIIGTPRAAAVIEGHETHSRTGAININLEHVRGIDKNILDMIKDQVTSIQVTQTVIYGWYDNEMASYVNMLGDRTVSIAEAMH
jgi:glyceraldehyde 3-phosphate dehydrogenase